MSLSPRVVLIPLAGAGGGPIARVQADSGHWARNAADLNPRIAELRDWGLYEAGAIAVGAMQRLDLRPEGLALAQRMRLPVGVGQLRITNGPDLRGLSSDNAQSAELGLALALLMQASQSRDTMVAATGALARDAAVNASPEPNVRVLPVARLAEKIDALERSLEIQKGVAYARRLRLFLPVRTLDGTETLSAHATELERLTGAMRANGVALEVCPVASLKEALDILGIEAFVTTPADRWLARGMVAACVLALFTLLFYRWLISPLDLAFAALPLKTGEMVLSPVRAVYETREGSFRMRPACLGEQRLPTYQAGESLVFRAALKTHSPLARALGGYHFVVVGVSEQSGVKVYPPETFGTAPTASRPLAGSEAPGAPDGFDLRAVLPIQGPQEKSKLIILVRKLRPFDVKALHDELATAVAGKPPAERINTVVTRLAGYAPGYMDYTFQSVEGESACEPK